MNYKKIHKNVSDVLRKAHQKKIQMVLSVSTDLSDYHDIIQCVGYRKNVVFSCGVHPMNLHHNQDFNHDELCNLVTNQYVVAIGETGLDYYRCTTPKNVQKTAFADHITIAKKINKPLIVHSRHAIQDTITVLREEHAEQCSGLLHCFNEDINTLRSLLDINFYISFSGIVTFQNSDCIKTVIQYTPMDRILLETDAPYLTPRPYRGTENQPAYLYEIAEHVAHIKNITIENLAYATTSNFHKLFRTLQ